MKLRTKETIMRSFRWLGLPAAAALAVSLFALTAGIASARTTVAPKSTTAPQISGKAQVGQTLTTDNGTWTGTAPLTFTYQWRICNDSGNACHDITGATGNEYTVKTGDSGNTLRIQVTAKNSDGADTATSVPTAAIAAAGGPTPLPTPAANGCPKLAAGAAAVSVADVSTPARLQIDQMQSNPGVIKRGTGLFTVRFHVSDTCGSPVQGAQVYATGVPYNMISIPAQQQTDNQGWVSMQFKTMQGFPATAHQQLLVMFVRASKQGDPVLAGISTRRLVSLRVNLNG
jgi:hypothetical protein